MLKICKKCNIKKQKKMFHTRKRVNKSGEALIYYYGMCKKCWHEKNKLWRKLNPGKDCYHKRHPVRHKLNIFKSKLKKKFGISVEEYNKMLFDQNGLCKICGCDGNSLGKRLAVDHCHKTGKIRGLLCHHCNLGLGNFSDSAAILTRATQYLEDNK